MEQHTFGTAAFEEPPFESRQIVPFCTLPPDVLPGLNRSLGLAMPAAVFSALQAAFRDGERRNPTVGEVRLLATLHALTVSDAARAGVGEVCTDSDAVAETWADLMARRRLLADGVPAPCTLPDIVTATDTFLRRMGERSADAPVRVLTEDAACPAAAGAQALADGYVPVARFVTGDTARLVCTRRPEDTSARAERAILPVPGDLIVLLRGLPDAAASALIRSCHDPRTGQRAVNAVALSGRPLPLAVAALCGNGAEIRTDTVCPAYSGGIMTAVARAGTGEEDAARPACLLRLRRAGLQDFRTHCRTLNLPVPPVVIGQAVGSGRLTFLQGETVLASCLLSTLRVAVGTWLYSVYPDAGQPDTAGTAPVGADFPPPALLSLPGGVLAAETSAILTAGTDADRTPDAYRQSMQAVRAALDALTAAGADPGAVSLSVSLSGIRIGQRDAQGARLPDVAFGGLCGLYRACAELRLPAPDPCLTAARTAGEPCRLSVCAWVMGVSTAPAD